MRRIQEVAEYTDYLSVVSISVDGNVLKDSTLPAGVCFPKIGGCSW
jgi:hypothetical protein